MDVHQQSMFRPPWHRWHTVGLAVALLWLASWGPPPAVAAALAPGSSNTAALVQTVWGGGTSGNTPSNTSGLLGAASLSSAGPTAWMGSSTFCPYTSNFLLLDSGHPTTIKVYNAQSATGLSTFISNVTQSSCPGGYSATSVLKAVETDNSTNLWIVDAGCGNLVFYKSSSAAFTTVMSLVINPTLAVSLAMKRDSTYLFLSFSSSILRLPPTCSNMAMNCSAYRVSLVAGSIAPSNLTLSFNEQSLYFIDVQSINRISALMPITSYPVTPTTLVTTGLGQAIVNPTAMAMSPDGLGLIIADYMPAGYSQIKYLSLSTLAVVVIGPNKAQSNCGTNSSTYQNGWIGGPACFGLIHQIITGTGTMGNQMLFFEVNTGRIRALDWSTRLVRTVIGGGPANNGISNPNNVPNGWATGVSTESSFDSAMTALAWNVMNNTLIVAEPVSYTHCSCVHYCICLSVLVCSLELLFGVVLLSRSELRHCALAEWSGIVYGRYVG